MNTVIKQQLQRLFDLGTDLANHVNESDYGNADLGKGNSVGQILLDLVCTREQYLYVLKNHTTRAWSCSVDDSGNKLQIMQALFHSAADLLVWIDGNQIDEKELQVLLKIIEQESYFHGQLIQIIDRDAQGLPESWLNYYTK